MLEFSRKSAVLVICLLLLYISWGSTFLANKIGLEYFPGFMLTGLRVLIAGFVLLVYTYVQGEKSIIKWHDIKLQGLNGFFMVLIASALVSKAQEYSVPSGVAAILYGAAPIWLMLGEWIFWGGQRPSFKQAIGLSLGFAALIWLNVHQGISGEASIIGLAMIVLSTFAWVYGSHFSQRHKSSNNLSVLRTTGLLLFLGGIETLVLSLAIGERVDLFNLPSQAYYALAHLVIFSSIIAYSTYIWLLFNSRAIVAISYEYVVPVVAIVLGAIFANENVDVSVAVASAIMIMSVFLITTHNKQ